MRFSRYYWCRRRNCLEKENSFSFWWLDSLWSGESKMPQKSFIKVLYFLGARISDMFLYLGPLLHKKLDKMILHIGTNNSPFYSATQIVEEIGKLNIYLNSCIVISTPTLRMNKVNANLINSDVTERLRTNEEKIITHPNIKEEHLDKYDLYINNIDTSIFSKKSYIWWSSNMTC